MAALTPRPAINSTKISLSGVSNSDPACWKWPPFPEGKVPDKPMEPGDGDQHYGATRQRVEDVGAPRA